MIDGDIFLARTGTVEGRQWTESNYSVAVYYKGSFYSHEVLAPSFQSLDSENWNMTSYIDDLVYGYHEDLSDDVISYLEY